MKVLGENENPKIWEKNIFEAIKDLSDIELQKLFWSGKHPQLTSSLTETLARLYDDLDFKRYIQYYNSIKTEDERSRLFEELNGMMEDFKEYGYKKELEIDGYKKILNDPKWISITEKAKEIIVKWNNPAT